MNSLYAETRSQLDWKKISSKIETIIDSTELSDEERGRFLRIIKAVEK